MSYHVNLKLIIIEKDVRENPTKIMRPYRIKMLLCSLQESVENFLFKRFTGDFEVLVYLLIKYAHSNISRQAKNMTASSVMLQTMEKKLLREILSSAFPTTFK